MSPSAFTTDIDQQVTDNYAYDDNGSLQKDDQRDIGFIVNDIRNLPVSVWKKSTGQEFRYYYDTEGRRIRKDAEITEYYVNSPSGNTEAVVKSDISQATHNIWGLDNIGQAKRAGSNWARYYYLKDHLGSIKITVDGIGNKVGWDGFYPFGMVMEGRSGASGSDPRYKYTSNERDAESSLDYFGARYYDARLGRFLSVDRFAGKSPQASPYHYALSNPLRNVDLNGDSTWVTQKRNTVTIHNTTEFHGTAATKTAVAKIRRDILAKWHNAKADGKLVKVDLKTTVSKSGNTRASYDQIAIMPGAGTDATRSNTEIHLKPQTGTYSISGTWYTNEPTGSYAHEFGHQVGYFSEDYQDVGGKSYELQNSYGVPSIMGADPSAGSVLPSHLKVIVDRHKERKPE